MGVNELSTLLWRERELLELLVFKLEEEQLLLTAGRSKWLQHATREVEQVLGHLRTTGIERTVEAASVAAAWGVPEDATLRQLAEAAPNDAWRDVLLSHLTALTALTAQIADVRDTNLSYLRAATRATQETLATVGGGASADVYGAAGRTAWATAGAGAHLFDRQG
ncbi:flagellar protein FlgN [Amnibacterium sp.]|uniref:flagellar protein FlgN n=1 Tax=Amnibacterium sp. TaxID=1872496 RepID=UPI003F7CC697